MRLEGKVALISGGARGQGAAEARLFAKEGAKVVFGDILENEGRKVEEEINEAGGDSVFVKLDVVDRGEWQNAVQTAISRYGKLNVLVNNAGIAVRHNIDQTTDEDWSVVMGVNVGGLFLGTVTAVPEMRSAGGGAIVNVSSTAAIIGVPGAPPTYTASKGAVRSFSRQTAVEYGKYGIRVNCVLPGIIETDFNRDALAMPGAKESRIKGTPIGRLGTAQDVAYAILFLVSDEASFISGAELVIDGAWTSAPAG